MRSFVGREGGHLDMIDRMRSDPQQRGLDRAQRTCSHDCFGPIVLRFHRPAGLLPKPAAGREDRRRQAARLQDRYSIAGDRIESIVKSDRDQRPLGRNPAFIISEDDFSLCCQDIHLPREVFSQMIGHGMIVEDGQGRARPDQTRANHPGGGDRRLERTVQCHLRPS